MATAAEARAITGIWVAACVKASPGAPAAVAGSATPSIRRDVSDKSNHALELSWLLQFTFISWC